MRKIFNLMILISLCFLFIPKASAQTNVLDQSCPETRLPTLSINGIKAAQTFKPSKNVLTMVEVYVKGPGKISLYVLDQNGKSITNKLFEITSSNEAWQTHSFGPINVNTAEIYKIQLQGLTESPYWSYKFNECYTNGSAFINGREQSDIDFSFRTWGYNLSNPETSVTAQNNESENNNSDSSNNTQPKNSSLSQSKTPSQNSNSTSAEEPLWKNPYLIIALTAAFVSIIGFTSWYLIARLKKNKR